MENNFSEEQKYLQAKKRVKDIKGFYIQFFLYCTVTPIIIAVNLIFSPGHHWFWYSTIGWAFGIFFHWMAVFGFRKIGFSKDWEEKKIREIMEEEKNKNN
jgi:hypothetical protein